MVTFKGPFASPLFVVSAVHDAGVCVAAVIGSFDVTEFLPSGVQTQSELRTPRDWAVGGGWDVQMRQAVEWRPRAISHRLWPGHPPCLCLKGTGHQHRGRRGDTAGPGAAGPQGSWSGSGAGGAADTGCGEVACAGHQWTACDLSPTEERGRWEGPSPQRTLTHTGVHTCTGTPDPVQARTVTQVCIPTQVGLCVSVPPLRSGRVGAVSALTMLHNICSRQSTATAT